MEVVRCAVIDWEPLSLTIRGEDLIPATLEQFTQQWIVDRDLRHICRCHEKSLSVVGRPGGDGVVVYCEWMCEVCVEDYCRRLAAAFPNVSMVRIGLNEDEMAVLDTATVDTTARSPYVDVPEKLVEFEDGRRVLVPPFRIARRAVTLGEFIEFVEATDYETTAQQEGLRHTFLHHAAMSPFEHKRITAAVKCVSFYNANEYCAWKESARLPTEPEWLAASIVDERVYDDWADRHLRWTPKTGRPDKV